MDTTENKNDIRARVSFTFEDVKAVQDASELKVWIEELRERLFSIESSRGANGRFATTNERLYYKQLLMLRAAVYSKRQELSQQNKRSDNSISIAQVLELARLLSGNKAPTVAIGVKEQRDRNIITDAQNRSGWTNDMIKAAELAEKRMRGESVYPQSDFSGTSNLDETVDLQKREEHYETPALPSAEEDVEL